MGGVERPSAARRIVRQFDFDKPEAFSIPRHWDLAQDGGKHGERPGFPSYNGAELDHSTDSAEGGGSVRLFTRGGSTSLRLDPGVIPVFPETEYLVSARVTTRGLAGSRAIVTARYLDKANLPIPWTESRGDPIATAAGEWVVADVPLSGFCPEAAYIQIDLEIVQPRQLAPAALGRHQVWQEDYSGDAWFDDVTVVQLPRVTLSTASPVNIVRAPDRPRINVHIRDLSGESLRGELVIQDAEGRTIDAQTRSTEGGSAQWTWEPRLPAYGWYRAVLELSTSDRRVGGTYCDLAYLPPASLRESGRSSAADRARFAVALSELPAAQSAVLPRIMEELGAGSVWIPVWGGGDTPESIAQAAERLVHVVGALATRWCDVTFVLPRVPDPLAQASLCSPHEPSRVFGGEPALWMPYLLPLVDKYGQTVQRWQVGGLSGSPPADPDLAANLGALERAIARLVPGPRIAVPWPADVVASDSGMERLAVERVAWLPYESPPESILPLIEAWRRESGRVTAVVAETLPPEQYSRRASAALMVKKAIDFWRASGSGSSSQPGVFALRQPWRWPTSERPHVMPDAEAAALSNLIDRLSERRMVGQLSIGPGVTCYILGPNPNAVGRGGALVAWSHGAAPREAVIDVLLGEKPVRIIDIWGNAAVVAAAPRPGREAALPSSHRIELTDEPVFVEDIDIDLVKFIAAFALWPDHLASAAGEQELQIKLTNPFASRIEGRLAILEPGGLSGEVGERDRSWRITPRSAAFSIAPGQSASIPVLVAFSAAEEAGPRSFVAEVELSTDRDYRPFLLRSTIDIRLDTLYVDLTHRLAPEATGPDVIVEAHVSNRGNVPATLELSAFAPGLSRGRASIADLGPGETTTRRFVFSGAAAALRGKRITVGVQDAETRARINRSVEIE